MTHTFKLARRMSRLRAAPLVSFLLLAGACDSTESFEPSAAGDDSRPSFAIGSSVTISNVSALSGRTYRVVSGLAVGNQVYSDRTYTFASPLPTSLAGLTYIQTANADKDAYPGSTGFLSFDIGADAIVYVAHDDRVPRPSWLTSGFQDTGLDLMSSELTYKFSVFKRTFPAGRVTLGSNVTATANRSMYSVIVAPTATETAVSSPTIAGTGIPFGTFGLPMSQYSNTAAWTASLKHLTPGSSAITELAAAKAYSARVVVSLAGGRSSYQNSDGTFSMSKWKYNVDKWKSIGIGAYINDGTIIGHYLVDEPNWAGGWGGKTISKAELEEMARYSKSIWPGMAATVRVRAGYLLNYTWRYLDFAWAQWEGPLHVPSYKMTPEAWRDKEINDAKLAGLKLMFGMNFLDAGDGSSGISGTYNLSTVKDRWQMSAAEVERVGKILAAASYACGVLSWRWSLDLPKASYMTTAQYDGIRNFNNRSDVKTAIGRVAAVARNRTATSCRR